MMYYFMVKIDDLLTLFINLFLIKYAAKKILGNFSFSSKKDCKFFI